MRYSRVNAAEFGASAGTTTGSEAWTYGLTWFVNDNARAMLNYVDTKFDTAVGTGVAARTQEKAIMMRGQYFF